MSERTVFTVAQGETHKVLLYSPLSSSYTATSVADLRRIPTINSNNPSNTVSASYTVSNFAGDSSYGPGFYYALSDTETDALSPGYYLAEPRISYTAPTTWVDKPLSWILEIRESITDAP